MKVLFKPKHSNVEYHCNAVFVRYHNGRTAIRLVDEVTGEPIATATVNMVDEDQPPAMVWIKDYSENAGMVDALAKNGVIASTLPIRTANTGKRSYNPTVGLYLLSDAALKEIEEGR